MTGTIRVHELAKELGLTSKQAIQELESLGEYVKSAASVVALPAARRLREKHNQAAPPPGPRPTAPRPSTTPRPAANPFSVHPEPTGPWAPPSLPRPRGRTHPRPPARPVRPQVSAELADDARAFGIDPARLNPQRTDTGRPAPLGPLATAIQQRWDCNSHVARARARPWEELLGELWVEPSTLQEFWDSGFDWNHHRLVADCVRHRIRPDQLADLLDGQRIGARLMGGEPVSSVVARLRTAKRR